MESLRNKMVDLRSKISSSDPDVVAICETWIQDDPLNPKFYPSECAQIPGYNFYRYDNPGAVRGGICIYVKPHLDGGICKKITKLGAHFEESAWHWLNIRTSEGKFDKLLFGCIYRKGASTQLNNDNLNTLLEEACKLRSLISICGDFNFPSIDWNAPISHKDDPSSEDIFMDTISNLHLVQHVTDFTRKRGTDNPSRLDLLFTDTDQVIEKPTVLEPFGKSDHGLITWNSTFQFCQDSIPQNDIPKHNYYKGNYNQMKEDLKSIDWDVNFEDCKNVNEMVQKFEDTLHLMVKNHVPMKRKGKNINNNAPWVDFKTLKAIRKKHHAWKRFQNTKSHDKYLDYVKRRNKATKKLRKAKKTFEKKIAKECLTNPKAFYSYANSHKKQSTNFIRLKKNDGLYTMNDKDTAEELNTYFQSVFTCDMDDHTDMPNLAGTKEHTNHLSEIKISPEEVQHLLGKVDPNKSVGDDGVHPRVLKECNKELSEPIYRIFKESLQSGMFPDSWKTATITPIYKTEERSSAENYRPISITSQVGKVLEKIVRKEIMAHIVDNNLLSQHQHGFCDKRSCMTNLIDTLEDITSMIDDGFSVDEVFLDFRKAFDKVSHQRLLYKLLHQMNIDSTLLDWIASFLSSRKQRVKVNNSYSSWAPVTSGVPQGSVLGPMLFVVFINDLPSVIKTNCKLFADDSKIYGKVNNEADQLLLQEDLDACYKWANDWKMTFHPKKSKVMHIGNKNNRYLYLLGHNLISETKKETDLGILVSDNLSWSEHVANCAKKANRVLGMVKHTFSHMDKEMFISLYQTLIRPQMEYCPQVWSPHLQKDISILEKVQRRATKIVPGLEDLPYEQRLKALKLYPLEERRTRGDMICIWKMLNGHIDIDCNRILPINKGCNSTRSHAYQILGKVSKNNSRKNFFTQRVIHPWNTLSSDTVNSTTVEMFKGRYDKERLGNYLN